MAPTTPNRETRILNLRDVEVPLVCAQCNLVHHVGGPALAGARVTCPHCGHARDAAALRATLPRDMAGLKTHAHARPALSEFPARG